MTINNIEKKILFALKICCASLGEKKAEAITILDVRAKSTIADFVIIATGNSDPHLKALLGNLEHAIKENKLDIHGMQYHPKSGWLVIDGFDFIVHLMLPEQRRFYHLETLWKEAVPLKLEDILAG